MAISDPLKDGLSAVELIDSMGSDLTVVNAARVSYAKRSDMMALKDEKLINYLAKHRHGTPFEHVTFQFRVRAPLFVVHQWERHRISSFNEESGRYIELRGDFYVKQDAWAIDRDIHNKMSWSVYKRLLEAGCPKEDARTVLPTSLYKEYWWTVNARSLMNFLMVRNHEDAQEEIVLYAQALEEYFKDTTPVVYKAFTDNGRVAP
jgi:thymidylate synthase (FAD)